MPARRPVVGIGVMAADVVFIQFIIVILFSVDKRFYLNSISRVKPVEEPRLYTSR